VVESQPNYLAPSHSYIDSALNAFVSDPLPEIPYVALASYISVSVVSDYYTSLLHILCHKNLKSISYKSKQASYISSHKYNDGM
jgi:hypothetical protein